MADKKKTAGEAETTRTERTVEDTSVDANRDATAGALDSMKALKIDLQNRLDAKQDETINGLTMEQIDQAISDLENGLKR
jgi:hypothetical protein